jgi:thiol-disulfide isomerase/thioredoxin
LRTKIINITQFYKFLIIGAILISLFSCNNEDISEITVIEVTHDGLPSVILKGDTFTFQVKANNSTDVTVESYFKVDGITIDGNAFATSTEPKEYLVQAFYKDLESELIIIEGSDGYPKNVLIEDYTGTWCGNCPRVSYAIDQVKQQTNRVVPVAIHISDSYTFDGAIAVNDEFGVNSYPYARLNRIYKWTAEEQDHISEAINQTGLAQLGVAITSTLLGNELDVTAKVKFKEDFNNPLKLVVYLTENGLIHDQENYTTYFGGAAILENFEHNEVLRAIFTHHLGDVIPESETIQDNIFTKQLQESIPISIENSDNLHLIVFVVDAITNEVINVRASAIGEIQDFE